MLGKRTLAGTSIAAAALAVAIGGPAGASPVAHPAAHARLVVVAGGSDHAAVAAWRTALWVRSDALNRRYHLGKYAKA